MSPQTTGTDRTITLNAEWLSDCSGCHVAIVDLHEKILAVLQAVRIQHFPVLTDIKDYPKATIGIVSGAIRTEHDREAAEAMRASCDLIIAWGSCAVYGGISGAGNLHAPEDLLKAVYTENKTTSPHPGPSREVSPLRPVVTPLDQVIDVDLYMPGCAPHPTLIFEALTALVEGRTPIATQESVCGRCTRTMQKTEIDSIRRPSEGLPDRELCFLSQGYLCMGSATLDRCMSPCPQNGIPCSGCAGATMRVLTEPNRDIRTEIAERMTRLTRIPREAIVKEIERNAKTHYSYTMATAMIGEKPTFLIRQWLADAEADHD